jgi:hypothetical protein
MASPDPPRRSEAPSDDSAEVLSRRVTFSLIFSGSIFRHRQVLKLAPLDHTLMRYKVSLDFTIPPIPPYTTSVLRHVYVPVAVVSKRVLGDVDLTDEQDRSLPILNREDESELTRHFIVLFWLTNYVDPRSRQPNPAATETDLPEEALQLLVDIIRSQPTAASNYLDRFEHGWEADWHRTIRSRSQETLLSLIRLLADQAMVYALLQGVRLGVRRIVKLNYNDVFPSTGKSGWTRSLLQLFSLSPVPIYVHIPSAVNVASFHLEMTAPPGLAFLDGYVMTPDDRRILPGSVPPLGATHAHFYLPQESRAKDLRAELFLLPEQDGWMRTASLTAWFVAAAIVFFAVFNPRLSELGNPTPAANALLAAGAIIAVYLAQPLEHRLTSRLLRGARGLIVLSGLVAAVSVAIALLTGEPSRPSDQTSPQVWTLTYWRWLCVALALLAAIGLWPGSWIAWAIERSRRYQYKTYRILMLRIERIGDYFKRHAERRARQ